MSFFFGEDPFCEVERQPENTRGADRSDKPLSPFAWETSIPLLFAWATSGSLHSVQNYRPCIVFSSPMRKYEQHLRFTYFSVYGWSSELTYFLFFRKFVDLICERKYLSFYPLKNKLYSLPSSFIFFSLFMLSCDCIESLKFIVAS